MWPLLGILPTSPKIIDPGNYKYILLAITYMFCDMFFTLNFLLDAHSD